MAMIPPILPSPPSFIAPRSTLFIVTVFTTITSTPSTATFSTPSYTTLSPTTTIPTTTTTTSITPTSDPSCETESFFYSSCTGREIFNIIGYTIIALGLFACVFGVISFFYDDCIWTSSATDSYRDTESETGIEVEMQSRHIEERVIEGAKAEAAQRIAQVQPVYNGV